MKLDYLEVGNNAILKLCSGLDAKSHSRKVNTIHRPDVLRENYKAVRFSDTFVGRWDEGIAGLFLHR